MLLVANIFILSPTFTLPFTTLIKVTIPQDNTLVYFQLYGKNPRIPNKNGEYTKNDLSNLIIAYEPVYSIGTGDVMDNETIEEVILWIKEYMLSVYDVEVPVLYGGSVSDSNIATLNEVPDLDGFLVGKASLSVDKINTILEVISSGKIME